MNFSLRTALAAAALVASAAAQAAAPAAFPATGSITAGTPISYTFILDADSSASFTAKVKDATGSFIKPFYFDLYDGSVLVPTFTSQGTSSTKNSYTSLLAGTYTLKLFSTVNGTYEIKPNAGLMTSAVPEPESLALALAGVGIAGTMLRRRKQA